MVENKTFLNSEIPTIQKVIAVLWPSFLAAGVETIVFFTIFDPLNVFIDYNVTRLAAYSIGFFLFWAFAIVPCILTLFYTKPCKPCADHMDEL